MIRTFLVRVLEVAGALLLGFALPLAAVAMIVGYDDHGPLAIVAAAPLVLAIVLLVTVVQRRLRRRRPLS